MNTVARIFVVSSLLALQSYAEASLFSVRVDTPFDTGGPNAVTDSGPNEAEASNSLTGNHIWQAYGYAGPGVLKSSSDAWSNGDFSYDLRSAVSSTEMWLDDVVFTSSDSSPISVTLNLTLNGEIVRSGVNTLGEVTVNKILIGVEFGGFLDNGEYEVVEDLGSGLTETSSGLLTGLSGDIINEMILVNRTVPVNTPVSLRLVLETQAAASQWTSRTASNFADSFGFVQGSRVFSVPEGVTVNSVSGGIVDNQYIPEPTSAILVVLVSIVAMSHRRVRM
jgi:hypothetical protein